MIVVCWVVCLVKLLAHLAHSDSSLLPMVQRLHLAQSRVHLLCDERNGHKCVQFGGLWTSLNLDLVFLLKKALGHSSCIFVTNLLDFLVR